MKLHQFDEHSRSLCGTVAVRLSAHEIRVEIEMTEHRRAELVDVLGADAKRRPDLLWRCDDALHRLRDEPYRIAEARRAIGPCGQCGRTAAARAETQLLAGFRLYALRSTVDGREIVKFGELSTLHTRLADIRRCMPEPVELIGSWRGVGGDRMVHLLLADRMGEIEELRIGGRAGGHEWYYRDAEIDDMLTRLLEDAQAAQDDFMCRVMGRCWTAA